MELHFLGHGAAFYVEAGNTSAYLREGSRLLLLDCGESVFADLLRRGALSGVTDITIALSHLHSDHCGSLGSLCHYCFYMLHIIPKLVLPEDAAYRADVATLLRLFGVQESSFTPVADGGALGFSSFRSFRYVPTRHSDGMRCFSSLRPKTAACSFRRIPVRRKRSPRSSNHIRISNAPTWIPRTRITPATSTCPSGRLRRSSPRRSAAASI